MGSAYHLASPALGFGKAGGCSGGRPGPRQHKLPPNSSRDGTWATAAKPGGSTLVRAGGSAPVSKTDGSEFDSRRISPHPGMVRRRTCSRQPDKRTRPARRNRGRNRPQVTRPVVVAAAARGPAKGISRPSRGHPLNHRATERPGGVHMAKPHQKTSPEAIAKRQRMAEALKYRSEGLLYREISEKMDIGLSTAYQYVRDAVDELPRENAELVFSIELDRLDMAQKALRPAVEDGDPKSIEAWLKIHDKRVKLFHLDKLHGKGDDTGDNVIDRLAKAVAAAHEQQKDTVDDD